MHQALYRKWRPQTFDQIVGQEHVTQSLRNALASGRVAHAYLFAGLRGTGKTTMARLVAKAINCEQTNPTDRPCNECSSCCAVNEGRFLDLIEIDAASHTSVDDVRELRDKVGFRPNTGRVKVYIIDEVHRFSGSAFDALLKTIEEPPEHAVFILATTEIHKVPATILSRCQRFDFRRIPVKQIVHRLRALADAEKIVAEPEALNLIARSATGSLRDAESMLDQLSVANVAGVTLAQVQVTLGTVDAELVRAIVDSLVESDVARGLAVIDQALDQGADLRQFTRQIVNQLRGMLLIKLHGADLLDLGAETVQELSAQAERITTPAVLEAIKRFSQAETELRGGWQPQLPMELALVDVILSSEVETLPPVVSRPAPTLGSAQPQPNSAVVASESGDAGLGVSVAVEARTVSEAEATLTTDPVEIRDGLTLDFVQKRWPQIVEGVRARDKAVQALLNSAYPGGVQDRTVTLYVAHDFARSKLSQTRARGLVEQVIDQVVGEQCRVEYTVVATLPDTTQSEQLTGVASASEVASVEPSRREPREAWSDDPVVRAAREMGAEVRPIDEGGEV